jgi:hypothetical protein
MSLKSGLKIAERILFAATVLLGGYLIYSFGTSPKTEEQELVVLPQYKEQSTDQVLVPLKDAPDFAVIKEDIAKRDIFSTEEEKIPEAVKTEAETGSVNELPSNLKIVGVIVGKPTDLVVEDSQSGQTYFLTEGSTRGELTFSKIEQDKLFIQYRGRGFEIPYTTSHVKNN